jgi:hypothetical protein
MTGLDGGVIFFFASPLGEDKKKHPIFILRGWFLIERSMTETPF